MPHAIYPYLYGGTCWVFDDERTSLKEEAFVLGMTEMIFKLVEARSIPNASNGFSLIFASEPFDHKVELTWMLPTDAAKRLNCRLGDLPETGNWYRGRVADEEMIGWLCPALFCYFDKAPDKIFVKAEPLPAGVDPIWHVKADDSRARRFVSAPGDWPG